MAYVHFLSVSLPDEIALILIVREKKQTKNCFHSKHFKSVATIRNHSGTCSSAGFVNIANTLDLSG
jgi:hypothetical protein